MNEWGWVILGCALGIMLSIICAFCMIKQRDDLQVQVKQLTEIVNEHEEVIRQYEFYVWHNMKFFEEKEK